MLTLAELMADFGDGEVIRDASIADLGYVDSRIDDTLIYADTERHLEKAQESASVSAIITLASLSSKVASSKGLIVSSNPRDLFYRAHARWLNLGLYKYPFDGGRGVDCHVDASAVVSPEAALGDRVRVGPGAVIEGPVRVGSDSEIHAGAKVGVDGILYRSTGQRYLCIKHGGMVEIEPGATLFAGSVVARSVHPSSPTTVGEGSIIGINSIVGHDAGVGTRVVISGQCVLARRARVEDGAYIGTSSFIREHVLVESGAKVMAGSIVIEDVPPGGKVSGNYAQSHLQRMLDYAKRRRKGKG